MVQSGIPNTNLIQPKLAFQSKPVPINRYRLRIGGPRYYAWYYVPVFYKIYIYNMDLFWSTRRAVMVHVDYGFLGHKHLFYMCLFHLDVFYECLFLS